MLEKKKNMLLQQKEQRIVNDWIMQDIVKEGQGDLDLLKSFACNEDERKHNKIKAQLTFESPTWKLKLQNFNINIWKIIDHMVYKAEGPKLLINMVKNR